MRIDGMTPDDWPAVREIYEAGIATGEATFQTEAPPWDAWDAAHLPTARERGIGLQLLTELTDASEQGGRWTLQASIFPENEASVGLHERCGFRIVGRRERIACQYGRWRDTLLLERRSSVAGVANE